MREKCTMFCWGSPKEKDHLKDRVVDGRIRSECMLSRLAGGCRVDSFGSGKGPVAGSCEHGGEPSGSGDTEFS
jgi:hypothetical protein